MVVLRTMRLSAAEVAPIDYCIYRTVDNDMSYNSNVSSNEYLS